MTAGAKSAGYEGPDATGGSGDENVHLYVDSRGVDHQVRRAPASRARPKKIM
jgi:hypothetical protein